MENKLVHLLEKLLKLGWKPNGKEYNHIHSEANSIMQDFGTFYRFCNYVENGSINRALNLKLREIVSINSGLWQFVCENGMVNVDETEVYYFWLKRKGTLDRGHYYLSEAGEDIRTNNYEYRLIESSLKDESELEDFLLNSISLHE